MLGKKKFLWTNVLLAIAYIVLYFTVLNWWADVCNTALPNNAGTSFFYYIVMSIMFGWYTSHWAVDIWRWNTARYNEQYELEVNRFLYHYVELMDYKLNRHKEFKELRDLLQLAISLSKGEQQCSI